MAGNGSDQMLNGLMQDDFPLTLHHIRRRMKTCSPDARVLTVTEPGVIERRSFAESSDRIDRLARALASVINLIDPDAIVLGGGLSALSFLYDDVPRRWRPHIFSDTVRTRLLPPRHGDSSGVRGAAWLWPPEAGE